MSRGVRRSGVLSLICAALLVAPAAANGDTVYCVPSTAIAGCPAGATAEATITAAMTAVNADPSGSKDTIRIGPGSFAEGGINDTANQVAVIGEGEGATTIDPPTGSGGVALTLQPKASTVQGLTIDVAAGANNTGFGGNGSATSVSIDAGVGSTHAVGAAMGAGTFADGTVSVPDPGTGIASSILGPPTITGSTITAGTGVTGSATVIGSRIVANQDLVLQSGVFFSASMTVDDSLLATKAGTNPEVAVSAAATGSVSAGQDTVIARHDTLIGDGSAGSSGVVCTATAGFFAAETCTATIDSTVIQGFGHAFVRGAAAGPMTGENAAATIAVDYSDLDASTDQDSGNTGGGSMATATGQITLGTHDVNVAGGFVGGSGQNAYALTRQSALIDAGDPMLGSGEPATDLAGAPRVVAGHAGGGAVSDIGAFEYQDQKPSVTASASATTVPVGRPVSFTATGSVSDPGDMVTGLSWRFSDGSSLGGVTVSHAFTRAGRFSAVATVTDLNGWSVASAPVVVTVLGRPSISRLRVKPGMLRTGRRAVVSYLESAAARSTFTVQRKRGKRWKSVGSFTHSGGAGAVSFRFTGKVGGRALSAGRYRFSVVARNAGGASRAVTAGFSVVR